MRIAPARSYRSDTFGRQHSIDIIESDIDRIDCTGRPDLSDPSDNQDSPEDRSIYGTC